MEPGPRYPWPVDEEAVVAGVMSGTSCDGLDVAVCSVTGSGRGAEVGLLEFASTPYPEATSALLRVSSDPAGTLSGFVAELDVRLGRLIAEVACEVAGRHSIDLIASHGHTVCHYPEGGPHLGERCTMQIGRAAVIAEATGLPAASDFRARDLAAGGEGAPLLPYLDWVLLSAPGGAPRSIVNIGGMSNVTHLSGDAPPVGFDTGPGNLVINHAARLADPDLPHDVDGRLAASGTVDEALLGRLMSHPYLSRRPPKSTGREELGEGFVHAVTSEPGAATGADLVATLTRWVARSIARALIDFTPRPGEVVVCGGGAHNPVLMAWLSEELGAPLGLTDDFGVPGDAKEAMGFALLGSELMRGQPANVPSVTGAAGPRLLGSITWA